MKKVFVLLALVSLSLAQVTYIGPANKSLNVGAVQVGVDKPFSDTLLFLDGPDTLAAAMQGIFRLSAPPDTVFLIEVDTLVFRDTVTIQDTLTFFVHDTITLRDTIRDTVFDSLPPCGVVVRKYGCN